MRRTGGRSSEQKKGGEGKGLGIMWGGKTRALSKPETGRSKTCEEIIWTTEENHGRRRAQRAISKEKNTK